MPFEATAADVDEAIQQGESPQEMVRRLSLAKARAVAASYPEGLIVAADTAVALDGEVLGKPADEAEAVAMLRRLRGREHTVFSGMTVYHPYLREVAEKGRPRPVRVAGTPPESRVFSSTDHPASGQAITELVESTVLMRVYAEEEMIRYAASGDPLDKAGAYAIQHQNFSPVERITGCYANVMGLPLCHLAKILAQLGVTLSVRVPQACQSFTGHHCLVAGEILGT
jgi:predicted house-cleaning NTP pyrophosphatase (Maf/HAM1 superfamily)